MGVFLNNAAMVSILPGRTVQEMGEAFFEAPSGTGPFKFVEYRKGVHYIMEKNEAYWQPDVARVDRLILRPIFEEATMQAALQAGEIDVASAVSPDLAMALMGDPNVDVLFAPSVETTYLQVNVTREPLNNPKVVEALNYAIDREEITEGLFFGEARPSAAYVPPGLVGYHAGLEVFPYDPEKAKQLLAEAGYPNGVKLALTGPVGLWPQTKSVMEAIREQAKAANFDIELEILESGAYVEARGAGNYDLLFGSSIAVTHEGIRFLDERVRRDAHKSGYVNQELNSLIDELIVTIDVDGQQKLFERIQELMYGAPPMVFLYHPPHIYAKRKEVQNFVPRSDRSLHLWGVTKE